MNNKISSLQNPLVKHLVKLRLDPHYRKQEKSVLITSSKLIKELQLLVAAKRIFSVQPCPFPTLSVSLSAMKKITGLSTPEGIAAEFPLPEPSDLNKKAPLLALDRISDPGNMGTLLRTALALRWEGVFFLPGCVDPFHEKVLRSSRAALFRLPWKEGSWEELQQFALTRYTADTQGLPINEIKPNRDIILLLSNEGEGVSDRGSHFGQKITIPISSSMESLNVAVAGSIMMYVLNSKG